MGVEFVVDNMEDMCRLMCDNYIPERRRDGRDEILLSELQQGDGQAVRSPEEL